MIKTSISGIHQSDITLRTMLLQAFRELRSQPWLFDFMFQGLVQDELTRHDYGEKQINKAREWFLANEIAVVNADQPDTTVPRIVIIPVSSSEAQSEATQGDVHYDPVELVESREIVSSPPPILGPFTPATYDVSTGIVTLPVGIDTDNVFANMLLVDRQSGLVYPILEVLDDHAFTIATNVAANFTGAIVAPASSLWMARLGSTSYQETYRLEPHVPGTSPLSIYMHSILLFCLHRYKQSLLEARGFERTSISSGTVDFYRGKDNPEVIFVRPVTISGYVRQSWPKSITPLIQGVDMGIVVSSNTDVDADTKALEMTQGWGSVDDE